MTKLNKLVKQHEDIFAFGLSASKKPYYTIRESMTEANAEIRTELEQLFGAPWGAIEKAVNLNCDLDKRHFPENLF